ncbi:MAG: hypothetical protein QM784_07365 [Polyangiaceae bacterium]
MGATVFVGAVAFDCALVVGAGAVAAVFGCAVAAVFVGAVAFDCALVVGAGAVAAVFGCAVAAVFVGAVAFDCALVVGAGGVAVAASFGVVSDVWASVGVAVSNSANKEVMSAARKLKIGIPYMG